MQEKIYKVGKTDSDLVGLFVWGQGVEPLAGGWGRSPRIAEQSSAAAQTNSPGQKADVKPKKVSKEAADRNHRPTLSNKSKRINKERFICRRLKDCQQSTLRRSAVTDKLT